jgi:hypothetical protein
MRSRSEHDDRDARSEGERPVEPDPEDLDPRVRAAWRSWLSALATDADAAMAAALAYESLPDEGRDAWLDALDVDAPALGVPCIALYAPLLAVESHGARRDRIERAIEGDEPRAPGADLLALRGVAPDGKHACLIVAPLYLDFVQVLVCRYTPAGGFVAVKHEPLRHAHDFPPQHLREIEGIAVEPTPVRVVVEELAHAILADRRAHRETPAALASFAHLFGPVLGDADHAP